MASCRLLSRERPRPISRAVRIAMRIAFTILCPITSANLAGAEPVSMKAVSVHDGDTLTALYAANVQHKVRLTGVVDVQ